MINDPEKRETTLHLCAAQSVGLSRMGTKAGEGSPDAQTEGKEARPEEEEAVGGEDVELIQNHDDEASNVTPNDNHKPQGDADKNQTAPPNTTAEQSSPPKVSDPTPPAKAATAAEMEKTGARPKVPKDNPERRHLPFRRFGTEEDENGFPNAQQKIINDMHYRAYWEQEQERKDRRANEEQRLSLEKTLRQNNEHVKATKAVEEQAQAAAQKGQKKRKPKLADRSTYETALQMDAAFIDTMRNLNMDKQPTGNTRHSIKSPHVKSEPSFIAELKNELEELLQRPLEPNEDVLAIASTVLRQCMGNMYNTANNLTAAIEAA